MKKRLEANTNQNPVHYNNGEGKPFCVPGTKATKFRLTNKIADVTCLRCRAAMQKAGVFDGVKVEANLDAEQEEQKVIDRLNKATEEMAQEKAEKLEEELRDAGQVEQGKEAIEEASRDADETEVRAPRLHFDKSKYVVHEETTENGTNIVDVDDTVAGILRSLTLDQAYAKTWEIVTGGVSGAGFELGSGKKKEQIYSVDDLKARYADRNRGMQRMNLGNIIRGVIKNQAKTEETDAE